MSSTHGSIVGQVSDSHDKVFPTLTDMSRARLPPEILTVIIAYHLPQHVRAEHYLALRTVNKHFNEIILHALLDLDVGRVYFPEHIRGLAKDEIYVFRYWRARLRKHRVERPLKTSTGDKDRSKLLDEENKHHADQIETVLRSATDHILSKPLTFEQSVENTLGTEDVNYLTSLVKHEQCIYVLCKAAICIYGNRMAWTLLDTNIEEDMTGSSRLQGIPIRRFPITTYYLDTWRLYAAALLNDHTTVKAILEPIKLISPDIELWRRRVSFDYLLFLYPGLSRGRYVRATRFVMPPAAGDSAEQEWIKLISSTLIIAASMGHTDLVSYILRFAPDVKRKAFRTCLYRTSKRDAMGAAIINNQKEVFQILVRNMWPLVTKTGFVRRDYFIALEIAVKHSHYGVEGDSILGSILAMTDDWQCPYFLDRMLQAAAQQNNTGLGGLVLDAMVKVPLKMWSYVWVRRDLPRCHISTRPRTVAIATAALLGHAEFVELVLRHKATSRQAGPQAIECAIHSVVCHTKVVTENHIVALKRLLGHAQELFLEQAFVKAAYKHNEPLATAFVEYIGASQKAYLWWASERPRPCHSSVGMRTVGIVDPESRPSVHELGLAAALKGHKLQTARVLVEKYGIVLRRHSVDIEISIQQRFSEELIELEDLMTIKGMVVENRWNVPQTGFIDLRRSLLISFQPVPEEGVESLEFEIGHPHYCML